MFISLKSFQRNFLGKYLTIMRKSATTIAYINDMGGSRSITCNKIAEQIWAWAKCKESGSQSPIYLDKKNIKIN